MSVNSGLTSRQQRGHTETGPRFKVSSERSVKRGGGGGGRKVDIAILGFVI